MGISVVLGAVAWIVQDMDPVIKEGNVLERPEAEDSYKDQKLYVKGLLEKGGEVLWSCASIRNRIQKKKHTAFMKKFWNRFRNRSGEKISHWKM